MARKVGKKEAGAVVKISVSLDADVHLRLRLLATMRKTTATEIVAELVTKATEKVRLPYVGDLGDGNEHAA